MNDKYYNSLDDVFEIAEKIYERYQTYIPNKDEQRPKFSFCFKAALDIQRNTHLEAIVGDFEGSFINDYKEASDRIAEGIEGIGMAIDIIREDP